MKTAQNHKVTKTLSITIISFVVISIFSLLLLKTSPVFAQEDNNSTPDKINSQEEKAPGAINQKKVSITAIPPRLGDDDSLKARPGEKLQVQLRVRNLSDQTIDLVTSAKDFIIDSDGETPVAIDDSVSNRWSLASWLTITPTENTIKPKQTIGLNVLIEIPKDALPGGHYAMVLHQPKKTTGEFNLKSDTQSSVNQKVGTLIYVIVDGPINEEAYVRNFTFPKFSEYGPVPFSYTVENNSDIHITPQVNVEIFNMFNKRVENIQINSKNIFPLSSRDFKGKWKRIWGFGPYSAKLTMSFGSEGSVVVANTNFWLLPIKLVVAGLVALLTIIILALSIKRHLNHRREMDQKKIAELESKIQAINSDKSDQDDTPQL